MDEPTTAGPPLSDAVQSGPPEMTVLSPSVAGRAGAVVFPQIDGYRILGFLGAGGMGDVFKAVQLGTRREVALKLMRGSFASDRARARFDREVELTARLDHPNIARVFDSGLHHNLYFYAMELIDGLTLDRYVEQRGLGRREVLELFRDICRTVAHAHQRAVIHRDLKPSNIMISSDGRPRLLDFGLAKALADSRPGALTEAAMKAHLSIEGELSGTPAFMSPEQAAGHSDTLDTRTDVYSLGVILYRLLCGRLPHETTGGLVETIIRIREAEPVRPSRCHADIDGELESLMLKALAKEPDDRYASAGELARDVDNYLQGEPLSARPPSTVYFLRKRLWKHRLRVSLAAAVLVLLVAMAVTAYVKVDKARAGALAAEAEARRQAVISESRRRDEALARAGQTVSFADLQGASGNWPKAKALYDQAASNFTAEGAEPLSARVGIWNANRAAPPPLNVFGGSKELGGATSVALSADGRVAVTGSRDGHARVWDTATGRLVRTLPGRAGAIWSVALSSNGRRAVSGGADGNVVIWDIGAGSAAHVLEAPGGWVTHVALSPDGRTALSASGETEASLVAERNDTLCLWNIGEDDRAIPTSYPESAPRQSAFSNSFDAAGRVTGAVFSPDGASVLTLGKELALRDVVSGRKVRVFAGRGRVISAAFSADGRSIISGGADGRIQVWDKSSGKELRSLDAPGGGIVAVGFSPGKGLVYSAAEDRALRAWNLKGEEVRTCVGRDRVAADPTAEPAAAFSGDGRTALYCDGDGTLTLWGLTESAEAQMFSPADGPVADIAPFPGGEVALALEPGGPAFWDLATRKKLHPAYWAPGPADGAAVSLDGRYLVTVHGETLALFDASSLALLRTVTVKRKPNQPAPITFSPDGRLLFVPTLENGVAVIDADAGREISRLQGHNDTVTCVAASIYGRLLTGSRDKTARLWDVSNPMNPRELCVLGGHADAVNAVSFSPDGRTAATGGGNFEFEAGHDDFAIRLWDISGDLAGQAGRLAGPLPTRTLVGHGRRVRAVAFSLNGLLLASASDDDAIKLWDARGGDELRTLLGHTGPVTSIAFVPGSGALLSASEDHVIRRWGLDAPSQRTDSGIQFDAAARALQNGRDDPPQLAACGRWYAWNGVDDWSADLLSRAGEAITPADRLTLARCYWSLGQLDEAEAAFRRLMNAPTTVRPAPNSYLNWCLESVAAEKAGKAANIPAPGRSL